MSDSFTRAYIECALWSSTDDDGTQLGRLADSDIAPETYAKFEADCAAFQESYAELLAQAGDDAQNGHDFWLTRNGHGAGFWGRTRIRPCPRRRATPLPAFPGSKVRRS